MNIAIDRYKFPFQLLAICSGLKKEHLYTMARKKGAKGFYLRAIGKFLFFISIMKIFHHARLSNKIKQKKKCPSIVPSIFVWYAVDGLIEYAKSNCCCL